MARKKKTEPPPPPSRIAGVWWGVVGPRGMPCLFGRKRDAEEGKDFDERVAKFRVEEVGPRG